MNVIVLHRNFPGQFRHIVRHLVQGGHRVVGVGNMQAPGLPGVDLVRYDSKLLKIGGHRHLATVSSGVAHGEVVAHALAQLRGKGFVPDVVLAHPGWGEALYVKDVFPDVRLVSLFEFYYHAQGVDVGFEPGTEASFEQRANLCCRNMLHLTNLELCDAAVSPTAWQRSLHPATYQHKIQVAHEGVDTTLMAPDQTARFTLPDGRVLAPGDPVVTFVARNLEPYRGFHRLMRTLPEIQRRCPTALAVIVGGDSVSYGRAPKDAANWREQLLSEVGSQAGPGLDLSRVAFTGQIPYLKYRSLLQVSAAHVYLTYPFVLSWSMLEAMSCGCLVLGSATPPVLEVLRHKENGLTFDFFDSQALASLVHSALARPGDFTHLRQQARTDIVANYDIQNGIHHYMKLLKGS